MTVPNPGKEYPLRYHSTHAGGKELGPRSKIFGIIMAFKFGERSFRALDQISFS